MNYEICFYNALSSAERLSLFGGRMSTASSSSSVSGRKVKTHIRTHTPKNIQEH